ncbi:MAG: DNA-3-methyladenine glycosylase family protein [Angustibacter sp.]
MDEPSPGTPITVRLPVRLPWYVDSLFGHLAATAVPGVEEWRDGAYHRSMTLRHGAAVVSLSPAPDHVAAVLRLTDRRDQLAAVARVRWLLDLDTDPVAVDGSLAEDPLLQPAVAAQPGVRVPRCVDGDELAMRVVLGQQVSTAAARTVTGRLVARLGTPLPSVLVEDGSTLTHTFPTATAVAAIEPTSLPMPRRRATTLITLASALTRDELDLSPGADRAAALDVLDQLPGIGPWTTSSIAMRALGDPDAFLPTDLGVARAARQLGISTTRDLLTRADRWRPWRSYATQVLWGLLDHPINRLPGGAAATAGVANR